jgi:hypothetical protein
MDSALTVSDGQRFNFTFPAAYDSRSERWSTPHHALNVRLVDGRMADLIILGKIAQSIVPAVRKFAEENQALFLEAERRKIANELATLEHQIEHQRSKLEEQERELASVTEALKRFR